MELNETTKIGFTIKQAVTLAISIVVIEASILTAWGTWNMKFEKFKTETEINLRILEMGRKDNANNIELIRTENRQDHQILSNKQDEILNALNR